MTFARMLVTKDWAAYDALRRDKGRQSAAIQHNHDVASDLANMHNKLKDDPDKWMKLNSHMFKKGYMPQRGTNPDEHLYTPMDGNPTLPQGVNQGMKDNPVIGMPVHIVLNAKTGHADAVTRIHPDKD